MFCPDCGTENSKGQKFCTRCGASLLAVEYARSVIHEMAAGKPGNDLSASSVLRMVTLISILGLLFITMGTIFLSLIYQDDRHGPPMSLFFCMFGLGALVLIVKQIIKLIDRSEKSPQPKTIPLPVTTNPLTNHRNLSEGTSTYYSVTEERTKQLDKQ